MNRIKLLHFLLSLLFTSISAQHSDFMPYGKIGKLPITGAAIINDTAYITGQFDSIDHVWHKGIFAVDLKTKKVLDFNPQVSYFYNWGNNKIVASGNDLYIADNNLYLNGARTGDFVKLNRFSGTIKPIAIKVDSIGAGSYMTGSDTFILLKSYLIILNGKKVPGNFFVYNRVADTICKLQIPAELPYHKDSAITPVAYAMPQISNSELFMINWTYFDTNIKKNVLSALYAIDLHTMKSRIMNIPNGLRGDVCSAAAGNIWISTDGYQLYRYSIKEDRTQTITIFDSFRVFNCWDGIGTPEEYSINSLYADSSGVYCAGNLCGFYEKNKFNSIAGMVKFNLDGKLDKTFNIAPKIIKRSLAWRKSLMYGNQRFLISSYASGNLIDSAFDNDNKFEIFSKCSTFFSIIGPTTFLVNDTIEYSTNNFPHSSYKWRISGGKILSGADAHKMKVQWTDTSGKIYLVAIDSNSCNFIDSSFLKTHVQSNLNVRKKSGVPSFKILTNSDGEVQLTWENKYPIQKVLISELNGRMVAAYQPPKQDNNFTIKLFKGKPGIFIIQIQFADKTILNERILLLE